MQLVMKGQIVAAVTLPPLMQNFNKHATATDAPRANLHCEAAAAFFHSQFFLLNLRLAP